MKTGLAVAICGGFIATLSVQADSNVSSDGANSWGANVGWLNWRPEAANGVEVSQYVCAGYIYSANLGWIHVGNGSPRNGINYANNSVSDYGLNVESNGSLRGFAYGANIGWVNFEQTGNPRVNPSTGKLSGFVYGANIGWINLGDGTFSVGLDSITGGRDSDGDGIPDAWEFAFAGDLATFDSTSDFDNDGQTDIEECLAGTDPMDPTDELRILSSAWNADHSSLILSWSSKNTRVYKVEVRSGIGGSSPWIDSGLGIQVPAGATSSATIPVHQAHQLFRIQAIRPLAP